MRPDRGENLLLWATWKVLQGVTRHLGGHVQHKTDVSTPEPFHSGCGAMGFLDVWGSRAGRAGEQWPLTLASAFLSPSFHFSLIMSAQKQKIRARLAPCIYDCLLGSEESFSVPRSSLEKCPSYLPCLTSLSVCPSLLTCFCLHSSISLSDD